MERELMRENLKQIVFNMLDGTNIKTAAVT